MCTYIQSTPLQEVPDLTPHTNKPQCRKNGCFSKDAFLGCFYKAAISRVLVHKNTQCGAPTPFTLNAWADPDTKVCAALGVLLVVALQSTLHNKAISVNSATPTVICIVLHKQHWSHKCGCQYIQYNSAPYTHHKLRRWSASGNTTHKILPHPLPHLAWRPSCFGQSKHEAGLNIDRVVFPPKIAIGLICPKHADRLTTMRIDSIRCTAVQLNSATPGPTQPGQQNSSQRIPGQCVSRRLTQQPTQRHIGGKKQKQWEPTEQVLFAGLSSCASPLPQSLCCAISDTGGGGE